MRTPAQWPAYKRWAGWQYAPSAERDVLALGAVAGGVDIGKGGPHTRIDQNPAVHLAARVAHKRCICADAYGQHQNVKLHDRPVVHIRFISVKSLGAVAEQEADSVLLQMLLHP